MKEPMNRNLKQIKATRWIETQTKLNQRKEPMNRNLKQIKATRWIKTQTKLNQRKDPMNKNSKQIKAKEGSDEERLKVNWNQRKDPMNRNSKWLKQMCRERKQNDRSKREANRIMQTRRGWKQKKPEKRKRSEPVNNANPPGLESEKIKFVRKTKEKRTRVICQARRRWNRKK